MRGRKEGRGTYKSIVGAVYKGEYKADRRQGQGCEWYANGNEYEGGFDAGKRSGHGTMLYAGGDVYIGQWRRDMKHGRGTLRFAAGGVYQGAFRVGAMEGQGVYCFADGARYEGQYKAGKKEGRGVYQFADGSTYEGEYRNGRMDGFGAYQYSDGKTEVCRTHHQLVQNTTCPLPRPPNALTPVPCRALPPAHRSAVTIAVSMSARPSAGRPTAGRRGGCGTGSSSRKLVWIWPTGSPVPSDTQAPSSDAWRPWSSMPRATARAPSATPPTARCAPARPTRRECRGRAVRGRTLSLTARRCHTRIRRSATGGR